MMQCISWWKRENLCIISTSICITTFIDFFLHKIFVWLWLIIFLNVVHGSYSRQRPPTYKLTVCSISRLDFSSMRIRSWDSSRLQVTACFSSRTTLCRLSSSWRLHRNSFICKAIFHSQSFVHRILKMSFLLDVWSNANVLATDFRCLEPCNIQISHFHNGIGKQLVWCNVVVKLFILRSVLTQR